MRTESTRLFDVISETGDADGGDCESVGALGRVDRLDDARALVNGRMVLREEVMVSLVDATRLVAGDRRHRKQSIRVLHVTLAPG